MSKSKSYRKYAATTMAVAVAASAVAPVVAGAEEVKFSDVNENTDHYASIVKAAEAGYLKGDNGKFNPYGTIKRIHVAKVLQRALELPIPSEGEAEALLSRYTDIDLEKETQEDIDAIAAVTKAGIFGQFDGRDGEFRGWKEINREALASVIVRAYKLDEIKADEVEVNLSNVSGTHQDSVQTLANLGLTTELDDYRPLGNATRGQFAAFLDRTISKVEESEEVEPAVESVSAINANELQIAFNTKVTKKSAQDTDNYEVTINGKKTQLTDANSDIALSEDGESAIIRLLGGFDPFKSGDKVSLQVSDGIVTEKGEKLSPFASETLSFTAVAPNFVSAKLNKGKTAVEVTFDQPVQSANANTLVKVDGYELAEGVNVFAPTTKAGDYTYTISLNDLSDSQKEEVKAQGTHELAFFDIANTTDRAQNPAVASVLNGSYVVDDQESAPEVESVTAVNSNKFFVVFDQDIKDDDFEIEVSKGSHTFTNGTTFTPGDDTTSVFVDSQTRVHEVDGEDKTGYFVIITKDDTDQDNPLYKGLEREVELSVKVTKYRSDGTGLLGKPSTSTVKLSKDAQTPTAKAKDITEDELTLEFDQTIEAVGTIEETDIIIRDKNDIIVKEDNYSVSGAITGKEFEISGDNGYKFTEEPYTVEFKKGIVKYTVEEGSIHEYSLTANKNEAFTVTVGKAQADAYKYYALDDVAEVALRSTNDNEVIVDFKTPLDKATALSADNYLLDGAKLPAGTELSFYEKDEKVLITFPENTFKAQSTYRLTVTKDVKTAKGQTVVNNAQSLNDYVTTFVAEDNVPPVLTKAEFMVTDLDYNEAPETKKLLLTFSEAVDITADSEDDVKVVSEGNTFDGKVVAGEKDTQLILTLEDDINVSQATTVHLLDEDEQEDGKSGIKDKSGNKAKAEKVTVAGKVIDKEALAEQAAQQAALNLAKTNAKNELDGYRDAADYTVNSDALADAITEGKDDIDAANDTASVAQALADAKSAIDGIDSDADLVETAKTDLDLGNISEVTGNLTLPESQGDATVTWSSDTPSTIANDGTVTRPVNGDGDATVTLTATITVGNKTDTKTFTAIVKEEE